MSVIFRHAVCAAAVCLGASACTTQAVRPLSTDQAEPLMSCRVPLAAARDNLLGRGYTVSAEDSTSFTTAFKASERDTERFMLGSISLERARQYKVIVQADGGVRFAATYREVDHPHPDDRQRMGQVKSREYSPPLIESMVATLKDMQQEVCDPPPRKDGGPAPDRRLWDYVLKRCKGGDDEACELLRPR